MAAPMQPGTWQYRLDMAVRDYECDMEGIVNNEMERNVAFITANGVSGVFKVTNNLRVERRRSES